MKTQKRTLRGIVSTSILSLALAGSLMPAAGLAFAADAVQAESEAASTQAEQQADQSSAADAAASDAASAPEGAAASEDAAPEADPAPEAAPAAPPASVSSSAAQYTSSSKGITAADVPLASDAAEPAAGTIEHAGIAYTINPDSPDTVSVTGLATDEPNGDVQIQSQVASGDKLYTVTGIEIVRGGFCAR